MMRQAVLLLLAVLTVWNLWGQNPPSDLYTPCKVYFKNGEVASYFVAYESLTGGGMARLDVLDQHSDCQVVFPTQADSIVMDYLSYESIAFNQKACSGCPEAAFAHKITDGAIQLYRFEHKKSPVFGDSYLNCLVTYYMKRKGDAKAQLATKWDCSLFYPRLRGAGSKADFIRYFEKAPELQGKLENGLFKRHDIITIVNEYNQTVQAE